MTQSDKVVTPGALGEGSAISVYRLFYQVYFDVSHFDMNTSQLRAEVFNRVQDQKLKLDSIRVDSKQIVFLFDDGSVELKISHSTLRNFFQVSCTDPALLEKILKKLNLKKEVESGEL